MKICKSLTLLMGSLLSLGLITYSDVSTPAPVTLTKLIAVVNLPVSPNLDKISLNSNNNVKYARVSEGSYGGRYGDRFDQGRERRDYYQRLDDRSQGDRGLHKGNIQRDQGWRYGGEYGRGERDRQNRDGGSMHGQPGGGGSAAGAAEMSKSTVSPVGISGGSSSGAAGSIGGVEHQMNVPGAMSPAPNPAASSISAPTPSPAGTSTTIGK